MKASADRPSMSAIRSASSLRGSLPSFGPHMPFSLRRASWSLVHNCWKAHIEIPECQLAWVYCNSVILHAWRKYTMIHVVFGRTKVTCPWRTLAFNKYWLCTFGMQPHLIYQFRHSFLVWVLNVNISQLIFLLAAPQLDAQGLCGGRRGRDGQLHTREWQPRNEEARVPMSSCSASRLHSEPSGRFL